MIFFKLDVTDVPNNQWNNKAMNASGTQGCSLLFVFLMSFDTFNSQ